MEGQPSSPSLPPPSSPTARAVTWPDLDMRHALYMEQHASVCDSIQSTQQRFSHELQQFNLSLANSHRQQDRLQQQQDQIQESHRTFYQEFKDLRGELQCFMRSFALAGSRDSSANMQAHTTDPGGSPSSSLPDDFLGLPPRLNPSVQFGSEDGPPHFRAPIIDAGGQSSSQPILLGSVPAPDVPPPNNSLSSQLMPPFSATPGDSRHPTTHHWDGNHHAPAKVTCPTFATGDPTDWIFKMEMYFRYHNVNPLDYVFIASMHLDGPALRWFQGLLRDGLCPDWHTFKGAIQDKFGPSDYENPLNCASVPGVEVSKKGLLTEARELSEVEARLCKLHEKIVNWDSDPSMIWDRDSDEASHFLQVVDEVQQIFGKLAISPVNNRLLCYADNTLQMAMDRLEDEFVNLLIQYKQPLGPEHMSFHSSEEDLPEDFSSSSFDEEVIQGKIQVERSRNSEHFVVDLIHHSAVSDLRTIAETMLVSKYDKECSQAYISVRKEALDECLSVFFIEKLSIEEVLQLDWLSLNSMIKRWNRALKIFIRVYLASESRLCNLIFEHFSESLRQTCFLEISKSSVMQFLNLGEAIAVGPLKPEKLFRILDMYECLSGLLTDIESLFPSASGSLIFDTYNEVLSRLGECVIATLYELKADIRRNMSTTGFAGGGVLSRLGECVIATLYELKADIRRNTSTSGLAGGGVHPVTIYVMNCIKALADYSGTLNMLLKEEDSDSSPVATNFHSITSILESNLADRSMLYVDKALQSLFLMNNICYMVQKVKDSDLRNVLGDDWIRSHNQKFRQHATNYERASWYPVLLFLKDDGIYNHGSNTHLRTVLKERFKSFNQALEEVYRNQTAWSVPNIDLREDLKISISVKVLQAYRTFVGRYSSHLDAVRHRQHYIKYYLEDLELALLDLFEGTPKVMHPLRR